MKAIIRAEMLNFVNPSTEQVLAIEKSVSSNAIMREVSNGFTVTDKPANLYKLILDLSSTYDLEIV